MAGDAVSLDSRRPRRDSTLVSRLDQALATRVSDRVGDRAESTTHPPLFEHVLAFLLPVEAERSCACVPIISKLKPFYRLGRELFMSES